MQAEKLPPVLDPMVETDPRLSDFKQRFTRWTEKSMDCLKATYKYSAFLFALERYADVRDLAVFVASRCRFRQDQNRWTWVRGALILGSLACRHLGQAEVGDELYRSAKPYAILINLPSFGVIEEWERTRGDKIGGATRSHLVAIVATQAETLETKYRGYPTESIDLGSAEAEFQKATRYLREILSA